MTASPEWVALRAKHPTSDFDSTAYPRLLVSVRSAVEAQSALAGGAEILDIKDPIKGSLGMASIEAITDIAAMDPIVSRATPLSVALGEVSDWNKSTPIPSLPAAVTYAKLGLSGCETQPDWRNQWSQLRAEFQRQTRGNLLWVAVAYADVEDAQSPSVNQILQAASETGCAGLLIDTWTKGNRSLLDFIDLPTLKTIATDCHQTGLFLALAGKLSRESLKHLANVPADVIAIRSAACRNTERTSQLDSNRVTAFHNELKDQFALAGNKMRSH